MSAAKFKKFYISGDIELPDEEKNMSRFEAERIIKVDSFYSGNFIIKNFICVMHLKSRIIMRATRDVEWIFDDLSLFQKSDGSFVILHNTCAPFSGGVEVLLELESNYFETHNINDFYSLFNEDIKLSKENEKILFAKRDKSFYAERWLSYNYKVLFGYFGYINTDKETILKLVKKYKTKFSFCPQREILFSHIDEEAKKAIETIEAQDTSWTSEFLDIEDYDPDIAEYD